MTDNSCKAGDFSEAEFLGNPKGNGSKKMLENRNTALCPYLMPRKH